jgi:hypothetical protein
MGCGAYTAGNLWAAFVAIWIPGPWWDRNGPRTVVAEQAAASVVPAVADADGEDAKPKRTRTRRPAPDAALIDG